MTSTADTRKIKIAIIRVSLRKRSELARERFFCRIRSVAIHKNNLRVFRIFVNRNMKKNICKKIKKSI